jgi:hypothetical protein
VDLEGPVLEGLLKSRGFPPGILTSKFSPAFTNGDEDNAGEDIENQFPCSGKLPFHRIVVASKA